MDYNWSSRRQSQDTGRMSTTRCSSSVRCFSSLVRHCSTGQHCSSAHIVLLVLVAVFTKPANTFIETPKFSQLRLLYPGYPQYGGRYTHEKLIDIIVGSDSNSSTTAFEHSTAAIRLSWTLNRYGGRHALGTEPVYLSSVGRDSFTGRDGQQYLFRNAAFGPFLAARYGNPLVSWAIDRSASGEGSDAAREKPSLTESFRGRQGIVRVVSYKRHHEDGHVALWDCTRFHESRDWTNETHVISAEFWESADSYCAPDVKYPSPSAHLEPLSDPSRSVRVVPAETIATSRYLRDDLGDHRHRMAQQRHGQQTKKDRDKVWLQ